MMPDFDGDYLCLIEKHEKCEAINNYWRVVFCNHNQWRLGDGEKVLSWQVLPDGSFEQRWHEMERELEKKMEQWDAEKRRKAAQAFRDLSSFIITE